MVGVFVGGRRGHFVITRSLGHGRRMGNVRVRSRHRRMRYVAMMMMNWRR